MTSAGNEAPAVFVDLNVLPDELRPRGFPLQYALAAVLLLLALAGLARLYQAERSAADETGRLRAELQLMDSNLVAAQVDLRKTAELRRQIGLAEADTAALTAERETILGDGAGLSVELSIAVLQAPAGVKLETASGVGAQMTLKGSATDSAGVLAYAHVLAESGPFLEARVTSLTAAGGEEGGPVAFVITAVRR